MAALVGMTAVLSGSIGCPLTAAVLSLELHAHNYGLLLPVFTASVVAHAFTVLFQKRSILTERISRRGYHLSREYGVDPLETIMVAEAVRSRAVVLPAELTAADAQKWLEGGQMPDGRRAKKRSPRPAALSTGGCGGTAYWRDHSQWAIGAGKQCGPGSRGVGGSRARGGASR